MVDARWNKAIDTDLSTAVYRWLCDHAVFVYSGFQRDDGTVAPARRWTDAAIAETDVKAIFRMEYTRNAGNFQRAWLATVEQLGQRFQDMIQDERWEWDRETVRSSGDVVSSPRDAVDTRELLESQVIEFES